jgi:hypothetical protein
MLGQLAVSDVRCQHQMNADLPSYLVLGQQSGLRDVVTSLLVEGQWPRQSSD